MTEARSNFILRRLEQLRERNAALYRPPTQSAGALRPIALAEYRLERDITAALKAYIRLPTVENWQALGGLIAKRAR